MDDASALARRLISLAIEFSHADRPLPLDRIHRMFYADYQRRSFYTVFRRDRESLAACGLRLREAGDDRWEADPSSFAGDVDVDPADLLALDLGCLQLASDSAFPYRRELRHALLKTDRCFSGSPVALGAGGDQSEKVIALLRARSRHLPVRVRYVDAGGAASDRTLAVWGEFGLRGHLYLVACDLLEDGSTSAPRVFRDDRFRRVRELDGPHYEIPSGFRAEDWQRLPFQIGEDGFDARLVVPDRPGDAARSAMATHGTLEQGDDRMVWHVGAADARALAAWAIAEGFVPLEPESLVNTWRDVLGEASR